MANKDEDNLKKHCECDDPCDDCTGQNLIGWLNYNKSNNDKKIDKNKITRTL